MSSEYKREKFKLRPRARIVKTFGEELISNDYVAIVELVKNSYDADATSVEIIFSGPLEKGRGMLIIKDNGHGMSALDVKEGWMEPASVTKIGKRKSVSGRPYLGEKGIGRFSAAKLAEKLTLITRKYNEPEIRAYFEWSNYYDPQKYLDEIEGWWETRPPENTKDTGTTLILEGLQSDWDDKKFSEMKIYLSRLINPLHPPKKFKINLNLPEEFKKYAGEVTAPISMQRPDYSISGTLNKEGILFAQYQSKKNSETEILHDELLLLKSGEKPTCGPITFEFRVWDRDRFKDLAIDVNSPVADIRRDLDEIAGISVFRDEFRISPYGDRRNDWLRLDIRRVQNPTLRISNNQVVGYLSITRVDNIELRDQTNREGIVESEAFSDLQEVTIKILSLLEEKRYKERRQIEINPVDRKHRLFTDINLDSVREVVERKLPNDKETQAVLIEKETEIKKKVEEFKDFIVRYRRLSTLGQLVDIVLHDAGSGLSRIINGLEIIRREFEKSEVLSEKAKQNISYATEGANILSTLFKRLEPFGGRKRERSKDVIIEDAVKDVFNIYSSEIEKLKIQVIFPTVSRTTINTSEPDFKMVFINLLNNSLYWINKIDEERKIEVEISSNTENIEIIFSDNGPGIPIDDAPYIFEPYYSKKPNGVGLGLTIVGEFIAELGGTFDLIEGGPLKGANFRIRLPLN